MSLRTGPIKSSGNQVDCCRISVMSRHTLNDGRTPDPEINTHLFDLHWPKLGPPPKLIGAYYRGEISWTEFEQAYLKYLSTPEAHSLIMELIGLAKIGDVLLLCIEDKPDFCHRRLLANVCQKICQSLEVIIN